MSSIKNAGKYNKLIEVCSVINVTDEDGFSKPVETSVLKPYANVKTTKGYTLIKNGTDFEKAYTNFTIRYPVNTQITDDMFIKYNNKTYTIEYLNNVNEESIELEIQAKVVVK
jgi:SPP1 family predicted phage head-tail adaptor